MFLFTVRHIKNKECMIIIYPLDIYIPACAVERKQEAYGGGVKNSIKVSDHFCP